MADLPPALEEIVGSFADLAEAERRDALLAYAGEARRHEPVDGEAYAVVDERLDPGCIDVVGIFLRLDEAGRIHLKARCGPGVQTLTKAMVAILCRGLEGVEPRQLTDMCDDFVGCIVGQKLMTLRGRTVFHVLGRVREAARALDRSPGSSEPCPKTS